MNAPNPLHTSDERWTVSRRPPRPHHFDPEHDAIGHRHGYVRRQDKIVAKRVEYAWLCSCGAKERGWSGNLRAMRADFDRHVIAALEQGSFELVTP